MEQEGKNVVDDFLGESTEVTEEILAKCSDGPHFTELAFNLYRETGRVLSVVAHSYLGHTGRKISLPRDQAICAGLLIRIAKFMIAVVQLGQQAERGEIILALNRCITESAVALRFLVLKGGYEDFIKSSLSVERELHDFILLSIESRGGEALPIETRMLESIERTFNRSGYKVEDVSPKFQPWAGGMRSRLKEIGWADAYVSIERIPSHAVHGTWVDLLFHHLKLSDKGFAPDSTSLSIDNRYLSPVCLLVLAAARDYLGAFLGNLSELQPLYDRIDNLRERLLMVTRAYEEYLTMKYEKYKEEYGEKL